MTQAAQINISSAVSADTPTYNVSRDTSGLVSHIIINGVRIDSAICDSGYIHYTVQSRSGLISQLSQAKEQSYGSQVALIESAERYLASSNAEWVLVKTETGDHIAPDINAEMFNRACDYILQMAAAYYANQPKALTDSSLYFGGAENFHTGEHYPVYGSQVVLVPFCAVMAKEDLPVGMVISTFKGRKNIPDGWVPATERDGQYVPLCLGVGVQ